MKAKNLFLLTLITTLLFSCSPKQKKTKASFNIKTSDIVRNLAIAADTTSTFNLLIMGKSQEGKFFNEIKKDALFVGEDGENNDVSLDLPFGTWSFYVLILENPQNNEEGDFSYETSVSCAHSNIVISEDDEELDVELIVDKKSCKDIIEVQEAMDYSLPQVVFRSCNTSSYDIVSEIPDGEISESELEEVFSREAGYCVNKMDIYNTYAENYLEEKSLNNVFLGSGFTRAFKVKLKSFNNLDGEIKYKNNTLETACVRTGQSFDYDQDGEMKNKAYFHGLPFPESDTLPIAYFIEKFYQEVPEGEDACSKLINHTETSISRVVKELHKNTENKINQLSESPEYNDYFSVLVHLADDVDEVCSSFKGRSNSEPLIFNNGLYAAGNGTRQSPYIVCKQDQLADILNLSLFGIDLPSMATESQIVRAFPGSSCEELLGVNNYQTWVNYAGESYGLGVDILKAYKTAKLGKNDACVEINFPGPKLEADYLSFGGGFLGSNTVPELPYTYTGDMAGKQVTCNIESYSPESVISDGSGGGEEFAPSCICDGKICSASFYAIEELTFVNIFYTITIDGLKSDLGKVEASINND